MIRQFCHDINRSQALDCLKRYKDEPTFDDKCKNIVIRRMIEQNTDYRFNTALQVACSSDINKHCKEVCLKILHLNLFLTVLLYMFNIFLLGFIK